MPQRRDDEPSPDRADEMQAHIDLHADQLQARGVPAGEARRQARLAFGNPRVKREDVDALGRLPLVDTASREIRFAARSLRRSPSFTATVIAVLALAIGASTVIFTVADTTVMRRLPFHRAERLVAIGLLPPQPSSSFTHFASAAHVLEQRARHDVFERVAAVAVDADELTLKRDGLHEPQLLRAQRVTADFFDVLRLVPAHGRFFTADHEREGDNRVAVISHSLWQRRFDGSMDAIGRQIDTEQGAFDIVGVMPAGFFHPVESPQPPDMWTPYVAPSPERAATVFVRPIARLADGMSIEHAMARLNDPETGIIPPLPNAGDHGTVVLSLQDALTGHARPWLVMLLVAAACVLLIACVNIANLVLVRWSVRGHELHIRTALGASRRHIARALLTESLMLSAAGVVAGLLLAWLGVDALRALMPAAIPRQDTVAIDLRVLATAATAAVVIGVTVGLSPLLWYIRSNHASLRVDQNRSHTTSRATQWLRSAFVVSEVALAMVLLVGAALFLASFSRIMRVDMGIDYRDVLVVPLQPSLRAADGGVPDRSAMRARLLDVVDRAGAIPGVEAAAIIGGTRPFAGRTTAAPVTIDGQRLPGRDWAVLSRVSADYFATLKIPIVQGRGFTAVDDAGSEPVVVLGQEAARQFFGSENPIGQVIGLQGQRQVVGVAGDVRLTGPEQDVERVAYVPASQADILDGTLMVRAPVTGALVSSVDAVIHAEFPDLALPTFRTLEQDFATYIAVRRFNMLLLTVFGALGLVIAAIGIYGVMAYVVSQRAREIGIRKALGALPSTVLWSVLRRASAQVAAGLAIGLAAAWMMDSLVASFLYDVGAREIGLYATAAVVLVLTGLAAALVPALRAARVDPAVALRTE